MWSIRRNNDNITLFLIERNADLTIKDFKGILY